MTRGVAAAGLAALLLTGCAGGPGPGDASYAYNMTGPYSGRLVADGQPFDATFHLDTRSSGRVRGSFTVPAPLSIEGDVDGVVVDDLLRVTLRYDAGGDGGGRDCPGTIEGVLTISRGGGSADGPVTITDCVDELVGRLSLRRSAPGL